MREETSKGEGMFTSRIGRQKKPNLTGKIFNYNMGSDNERMANKK
jgi:hypothetical protein